MTEHDAYLKIARQLGADVSEHDAYLEIARLLGVDADDTAAVVQAVKQRVAPDQFTLIDYKASWEDTCRGCHMDYFNSELKHQEYLSEQELEDALVELGMQESRRSGMDDETIILPTYEMPYEWRKALGDRVAARVKEGKRKKAIERQNWQLEQQRRIEQDRLAQERAQYEQLKAKFGGSDDGQ
jgi:hypothetical protein